MPIHNQSDKLTEPTRVIIFDRLRISKSFQYWITVEYLGLRCVWGLFIFLMHLWTAEWYRFQSLLVCFCFTWPWLSADRYYLHFFGLWKVRQNVHDKRIDMWLMFSHVLLFQKDVLEIRSQYLFPVVLGDKSEWVNDDQTIPNEGMNFSLW